MQNVLIFIWSVLFIVFVNGELNNTECPNVKTDFGFLRKRRHIIFPDGSNVVLTISLVKAFMTHAPAGWNLALEIDVLFPLPDAKFTLAEHRRKLHHRQKRDFWDRLKVALDFHNLDGRTCILRSICDAKVYLLPPGISLVHDILRAIFASPHHEKAFQDEIKTTYQELLDPDFCDKIDHCPFSLLGFLTLLNAT